jgi:lysyl oxidase
VSINTISGHPGELEQHNLYEFSPCHRHYHFKYYGGLSWSGHGLIANAKKGFCLQSTFRAANRVTSPLHNPFGSCDYQGVSPGWIDQYKAGLSGQWLDTTDLPPGIGTRTFRSNPNGFLCEGKFNRRPREPARPQPPGCLGTDRPDGRERQPCRGAALPAERKLGRQQHPFRAGDDRAAGIGADHQPVHERTDRSTAQLRLRKAPDDGRLRSRRAVGGDVLDLARRRAQIVRLTEFSHALDAPIPARYEDSYVPLQPGVSDQPSMLANVIVTSSSPAHVTFTCPSPRTGGAYEPGGTYSIYTAPVFPSDPPEAVARL